MTDVEFHFNVADRLAYGCRLLRKASRKRIGVAVTAPVATLDAFDRMLWNFADTDFVAHIRVRTASAVPPHLENTPIWLVERSEDGEHLPVLLNLGDQPADGFGSFERLIEIVSTDPTERDAGRQRWRHYASRGYSITRHEVTV